MFNQRIMKKKEKRKTNLVSTALKVNAQKNWMNRNILQTNKTIQKSQFRGSTTEQDIQ